MVRPGTYRHFSGGLYEVVSVGHHIVANGIDELPQHEVVIYHALFTSERFGDNHWWVRPVENFVESVEFEGTTVSRFVRVYD